MKVHRFLFIPIAILLLATVADPAKAADTAGVPLNLVGAVSSSSGAAIANASVFIYTAGPRQGAGIVCPSCYADCHKSTNSDASGKFEIKSLSPTLLFQVLVVAPGYVPTFFDKVDPLKGLFETRIKLRSITNVPSRQIIFGRVVNARKEPLANAVVSVEGTTIGDMTRGYPPKGTDPLAITDEHGEFAIQSATPFDAMDLRVEARGYARRNFSQVHPGLKPAEYIVGEGAALTGRVLWHGRPLSQVSVGAVGMDRSMGNFTGDFIYGTDENGRFLFVNLSPDRDYALYGLMDSFHPFGALATRTVHAGKDGAVTDVGTLEVVPGHWLAGRVKLSDGKPIPAHTHLFIGRELAWDTSTVIELPADGEFAFTNVPAETISISARIDGYHFSDRNASLDRLNPFGLTGRLEADKTNLLVLLDPGQNLEPDYSSTPEEERPENLAMLGAEGKRALTNGVTYSGQAFDVETKNAIPDFHVTPGVRRSPDSPESIEWNKTRAVDAVNGHFALTLPANSASFVVHRQTYNGSNWVSKGSSSETGAMVLLAQADGYLPVQSEALQPGQTNYDFQMHKGSGPGGVVRQPDGQPAAGVTVIYLAGQQQGTLNKMGELQTIRQGGEKVPTDAKGEFHFAPQFGEGKIFAANSSGFGWATCTALQTNGEVILQSWARVHGRLVKDGKPVAGENVELSGAAAFSSGLPLLNLHGTVTDDCGRFTIGCVPPGDMSISTRNYFGTGHSSWSNQSQRTFITRSGEDIDLGDVVKNDSER